VENKWKTLYRAGAIAPLIATLFYCSQFILLLFGDPFPSTSEGWFALVQRNRLLALWYLNALDILSFALLGIMFLALYVALRPVHPSRILIALYLALLGVVVFIVPRVLTLSVFPLSDLYTAASTEAERTIYLTAWETLSAVTTATPQTLGWLFMATAGLVVSSIILKSHSFGVVTGYLGIAGFVTALANYTSRVLDAPIAAALMPINGMLWLIWWLMISAGLFKLAKAKPAPSHRP
jgi:hypothetical protein